MWTVELGTLDKRSVKGCWSALLLRIVTGSAAGVSFDEELIALAEGLLRQRLVRGSEDIFIIRCKSGDICEETNSQTYSCF